jgi:hypothetical protein
LAEGFPSDIALQKAKLQFMAMYGREKSLPFYWAAPVLAGQVMEFNAAPDLTLDYLLFVCTLIFVVASVVIVLGALRRVTYKTSSIG